MHRFSRLVNLYVTQNFDCGKNLTRADIQNPLCRVQVLWALNHLPSIYVRELRAFAA